MFRRFVCIMFLLLAALDAGAADPPPVAWSADGVPPEILEQAVEIWETGSGDVMDLLWPYALPPREITVELHRNAGFRERTSGRIADWGVGVATDAWIAIDVDRVDAVGHTLRHVLLHELAHCLITQGTAGARDVPSWFHEGAAQYAAAEWQVRDAVSLVLEGQVPDLRTLEDRFPGPAAWADRAYRTSLLAAMRLAEWHGEDVMSELVTATRLRGSFEAAFPVVTGETTAGFAERFAHEVRMRYGWLFVITRWPTLFVIMALVFLLGAVIKRRRTLARMEAMPDEGGPEAPPDPTPPAEPETFTRMRPRTRRGIPPPDDDGRPTLH